MRPDDFDQSKGDTLDEYDVQRALTAALISISRRQVFNTRSIGRALAKRVDRIVGGLVLRARSDSSGTKHYWVEKVEDSAIRV